MKKLNSRRLNIFLSVLLILSVGFIFFFQQINIAFLILILLSAYYLKVLRYKLEPGYLALSFLFVLSLACLILAKQFEMPVSASPVLFLVILINVLYKDVEFSFAFLFLISILNSIIYKTGFDIFIVQLITGSAGIFLTIKVRTRFDVIKAGFLAGIAGCIITIAVFANSGFSYLTENLQLLVTNGIVSSIVLVGILPIFEYLLGVVTNISLLELSDFNHPLLRKMILEAPGTYQHSLVVANLAEAAAEAIGRNSLLARVGSYYHDIGKISKSEYFSENQMLASYKDRHKNLAPAMSKMIIMNHVKEGIELAKKYHLNQKIIDFITEHHGTTLVYYFFRRAQESKPKDAEPEEVYRYPGPKPRSKEVALVHLADAVEARSRTLDEPTPSRIREMVRDTILQKFLDGQLYDTNLTFRDLEKVSEVFIRILNAMFHTRVDYSKKSPKAANGKQLSKKKNNRHS